MKRKPFNKGLLLAVAFFLLAQVVLGQSIGNPKALVVKGTYTHIETKTEFPKNLMGYERKGVYSFDRKRSNIGATYKSQNGKTAVSIYLYPAGEGTEDRLRNEYLAALQEIAIGSKKGITAIQGPTGYTKNGYKVNGLQAHITDVKEASKSHLSVFECGKWFFKFRITSQTLDSVGIKDLEVAVLQAFTPTEFVKLSPLNNETNYYFAPASRMDTLIAVSTLGGAFKKAQWATDNISPLERAAGFPGLYLELHVESLKEFARQEQVEPEIRENWPRQASTTAYLTELNRIIESGYLREFVMDQYNMLMIVPEDVVLDFEGYRQWRLAHPISINLDERFYVLSYK